MGSSDGNLLARFDLSTLQIEEGTASTAFEPYKESIQYVIAKDPVTGEILEARSLPNGTKDEIRVSGEKAEHIQRNKKYVLQASDVTGITEMTNITIIYVKKPIDYVAYNSTTLGVGSTLIANWTEFEGSIDLVDRIGKYRKHGNAMSFEFVFAKGTTIEQARQQLTGTELTYQLAEPEIIPIEVSGNVASYPNGTMYVEPIVADAGVYNDGISIFEQELNIDYIDKMAKVDYVTGVETPLDESKIVIAEDKKSFTHPDLQNGDMIFFSYFYSNESTEGEVTVEYYDSRYVIPDKTLPNKFYKWDIEVDNGVPNVTVTEV